MTKTKQHIYKLLPALFVILLAASCHDPIKERNEKIKKCIVKRAKEIGNTIDLKIKVDSIIINSVDTVSEHGLFSVYLQKEEKEYNEVLSEIDSPSEEMKAKLRLIGTSDYDAYNHRYKKIVDNDSAMKSVFSKLKESKIKAMDSIKTIMAASDSVNIYGYYCDYIIYLHLAKQSRPSPAHAIITKDFAKAYFIDGTLVNLLSLKDFKYLKMIRDLGN